MINDHQSTPPSPPPSHRRKRYVKMELCIFMHTHIHALTHAGVHISTLHMCIHFASIAQMVKFKPVGLLKWWRHYEECSNTLNAIYIILHMANTGYKRCDGAHFHKMFQLRWISWNAFSHKNCMINLFSQNWAKILHLWFVKLVRLNHYTTLYFLLTTVYKHWKHNPHKCIQALSPCHLSPLLFICQHEVNRFYAA